MKQAQVMEHGKLWNETSQKLFVLLLVSICIMHRILLQTAILDQIDHGL